MFSFFGSPMSPGYTASKSGLVGLTKSLANGWSQYPVRVNAIAPGYIETKLTKPLQEEEEEREKITDRTAMKKWGTPEDIAGAAVYLASDRASYTTGSTITVDGGYSIT
jgi:NAD(P)-dependent dehydrogenase (short-subunit alcohol dehydrogenase family)